MAFLPLRASQSPSAVRLRTNFSVAILPATHADSLGRSSAAFSTRSDNAISLLFLGTENAISLPFIGTDNAISLPFIGPTTQSAFLFLGPKMESSVLEGGGFGYAWHLSPTDCSLVRSEDWPLLGPQFWKGNILGIKACSPAGLSCSPTLFNRLAGTTEYVLYNNGVKDPQRYSWATDRGILEGSSDPWLSAPGLQQVGLRKSSSGFCWRPIYYNIGTCGINTTNWSITSPNKQGWPVWQGGNSDDPLSGLLHRRHSSLNTYLLDTSRVPRKLFDCPVGQL